MPAIPRKAATIILLREKKPKGFDVLLLKRHDKSNFFAGNYVYPGGGLEPQDCSPEVHPYCRGLSPGEACRILGGSAPPEESLGYWVAGVRELFEEAGILFASHQNNAGVSPSFYKDPIRFSSYRASLQKKETGLLQVAQQEGILLALDQIAYYAHWITPEARPVRFDTRFFLARHPEGQEADHDRQETSAEIWSTPAEALGANLRGDIVLSPPTLKTLEELSRFQRVDDLLASARAIDKPPILPVLAIVPEGSLIVFPWDPEYDIFKKGEVPFPLDHGRPASLDAPSSRQLLKEGRWLPYCRTE